MWASGLSVDQLPVDLFRLLVLLLLEVDEPEEVQDLLVARAQEIRLLQLALGVLVVALVVERLALVEVGEEQALVEGRPRGGVTHHGGPRRDCSRATKSSRARMVEYVVPAAGGFWATWTTPLSSVHR